MIQRAIFLDHLDQQLIAKGLAEEERFELNLM